MIAMTEVVSCPLCGASVPVVPEALPAAFPFCSERCKLRDLGRWCDGTYVIPGKELTDGLDGEEP